MKKITVGWASSDDYLFGDQEVFCIDDDATEDEIEEAARQAAFEHFDWWFEEEDE